MTVIWNQPPPPARQRTLGRAEIVAAAVALADEQGAPAITMKAVAARLGPVTPMALYRYVHSKDGLVDLMLDAATAGVPVPAAPGPDWREDLFELAVATRSMITTHPWYAELVHTRPPAGPATMRRTEFILRVLAGQGLAVGAAMTYAALLDRHVYGSGLQEAQEARFNAAHGIDSPAKLLAAIEEVHALAVADGTVPLLTSWLAAPSGPGPAEQFELGLAMILDGIAARLRPGW
ncbi:TetR/AcrR family transcriptional regulator [Hamadaea tsunoensis]|uniref:TetR/AcrR family transcriptional regulator n=1 Tax=Hamadaea tsunoensis TaxID=53368 RepID=UPI00042700D7|nr:TetR/AcrR family transcriptional regulator [Hamadaea tsunoensis]